MSSQRTYSKGMSNVQYACKSYVSHRIEFVKNLTHKDLWVPPTIVNGPLRSPKTCTGCSRYGPVSVVGAHTPSLAQQLFSLARHSDTRCNTRTAPHQRASRDSDSGHQHSRTATFSNLLLTIHGLINLGRGIGPFKVVTPSPILLPQRQRPEPYLTAPLCLLVRVILQFDVDKGNGSLELCVEE